MKQQTLTQTNPGSSSPAVVNTNISPMNIGFGVLNPNSVTYTVEHTFDDPAVGFSNWFPHPTVQSATTNQDGNYAFPVTGVRITINAGNGTVTMKMIQAGI